MSIKKGAKKMNYYIQGNATKADKIKAAFERLGYDITYPDGCANPAALNIGVEIDGAKFVVPETLTYIHYIIKTHPDYKELELPKPHYGIANFQPFDKVLARVGNNSKWTCDFFSYYHNGCFHCVGTDDWSQCIPFNEDTKHLLGTIDMCPEEYINW